MLDTLDPWLLAAEFFCGVGVGACITYIAMRRNRGHR